MYGNILMQCMTPCFDHFCIEHQKESVKAAQGNGNGPCIKLYAWFFKIPSKNPKDNFRQKFLIVFITSKVSFYMFVSKANLFVRLNNCSHETRLSQLGGDYLPLLIEIELEKNPNQETKKKIF